LSNDSRRSVTVKAPTKRLKQLIRIVDVAVEWFQNLVLQTSFRESNRSSKTCMRVSQQKVYSSPHDIHFWPASSIVVTNQSKFADCLFAVRDEVDRNDDVSQPIPQD
jgi:hypothetical protein